MDMVMNHSILKNLMETKVSDCCGARVEQVNNEGAKCTQCFDMCKEVSAQHKQNMEKFGDHDHNDEGDCLVVGEENFAVKSGEAWEEAHIAHTLMDLERIIKNFNFADKEEVELAESLLKELNRILWNTKYT